ncbi:MAG: hypothetical protein WCO54_03465 [Bacteroidota bacterium]
MQSKAYPILSRTTVGGFFGGYMYTNNHLEQYDTDANGNAKFGWVVTCTNPGFTGCPSRANLYCPVIPPSTRPDDIDWQNAGDLLDYADIQIANGNPGDTGTKHIRVRVTGETFERDYTLTWSICADGSTTTIIDETDINI